MPYISKAQERWAHTPAGTTALGGAAKVHEWDQATKGKYGSLPGHVPSHAQGGPIMNKGYMGKSEAFAAGGPVIGKNSRFLKAPPDQFTDGRLPPKDTGRADDPEQEYGKTGKSGKFSKPTGDKSETPIKPR